MESVIVCNSWYIHVSMVRLVKHIQQQQAIMLLSKI